MSIWAPKNWVQVAVVYLQAHRHTRCYMEAVWESIRDISTQCLSGGDGRYNNERRRCGPRQIVMGIL